MTPEEMESDPDAQRRYIERMHKKTQDVLDKYNLQVGDKVRTREKKKTFDKESATFSKDIKEITGINNLQFSLDNSQSALPYNLLEVETEPHKMEKQKVIWTKPRRVQKAEQQAKKELSTTLLQAQPTMAKRQVKKRDVLDL